MSDFNWKVSEKVLIIEPYSDDESQINRSYIADYTSRSSIESIIDRSRRISRSTLNNFCYLSGVDYLPNEYLIENRFTLDITTHYSKSAYKGDYIEVRCKLTDINNKTYIINIELGSILKLLSNDNFKLKETKIKLGIASGLVGALLEDEAIIKRVKKKSESKTSAYEIGQLYKVGSREEIYWGEVYCWIDTRYINIQNIKREYININDLKILDEPTKLYIMSNYKANSNIKNFKDLLNYVKNDLNSTKGYKEILTNLYYSIYKNRTPRIKLNGYIDSTDSHQVIDEILSDIRDYILSDKPKIRQLGSNEALYPFFLTSSIENKPNYSDKDIRKIISILKG